MANSTILSPVADALLEAFGPEGRYRERRDPGRIRAAAAGLPKFELDGKRGRFRSYLWKLTYSGLVDEARRVKARQQAEEEWVKRFLIADEAESRKLHQELNEINYRAIVDRALPRVRAVTSERAWTCFEQRLLRDRPGSEIAAELGITDKAVFVYASRVLKAVRQQCTAIAEELGDEPIDWLSRAT